MVSNRSTYSQNQKNEERSRIIITDFFNEYFWKFRDIHDRENDLDGFIEVFDKEEDGVYRTTGKFLKAQLKSVTDKTIKIKKDGIITYKADAKFVHFCDVCDEPVILFICNVEDGKTYFLWMQEYIYKVLDNKNPNWRNNKTSVSLSFSPTPLDDIAIDKLRNIAYNGYKIAIQLRENRKYKEHREKIIREANKGKVYLASVLTDEGHERYRPVYIATKTPTNRIFIIPISALPPKRRSHYVLTKDSVPFLNYHPSTLKIESVQEIPPHKLMIYMGTLPSTDVDKISNTLKKFF
jgi:Domain of unknown function (DUF4365)/PemK-like, MazF-like toxin of type II toxin-antitoxin system